MCCVMFCEKWIFNAGCVRWRKKFPSRWKFGNGVKLAEEEGAGGRNAMKEKAIVWDKRWAHTWLTAVLPNGPDNDLAGLVWNNSVAFSEYQMRLKCAHTHIHPRDNLSAVDWQSSSSRPVWTRLRTEKGTQVDQHTAEHLPQCRPKRQCFSKVNCSTNFLPQSKKDCKVARTTTMTLACAGLCIAHVFGPIAQTSNTLTNKKVARRTWNKEEEKKKKKRSLRKAHAWSSFLIKADPICGCRQGSQKSRNRKFQVVRVTHCNHVSSAAPVCVRAGY